VTPLPRALDVGLLTRSPGRTVTTPIVLTERRVGMGGEIFLKRATDYVSAGDLQSIPNRMHFNLANTLMSIEARRSSMAPSTVLSTWQIGFSNSVRQHELTQAWPDCTPCGRGRIVTSTPAPPEQGLAVDVACLSQDNELTLRRGTGTTAVLEPAPSTRETPHLPRPPHTPRRHPPAPR